MPEIAGAAVVAKGLSESAQLHRDLTVNWDAFCEADPLPDWRDQESFPERLEAAGYAEIVAVDRDALESAFAAERGIYRGGSMWQLTPLGLAVRTILEQESAR